ncbi:uncharacterized protein PRD47_006033 [Ara ararauna]
MMAAASGARSRSPPSPPPAVPMLGHMVAANAHFFAAAEARGCETAAPRPVYIPRENTPKPLSLGVQVLRPGGALLGGDTLAKLDRAGGGARCGAGHRSLLPSCVQSSVLQPGLRAGAVGLPLSPRLSPEVAGVTWWLLAPAEQWPPGLPARVRAGARGARGRSPVFAHRLRSLRRAVSVQHWRRAGSGSRQRRQQAPRRFLPGILRAATVLVSLPLLTLCPGRCVTYTDVQASYRYKPYQWHYFKQFCKTGVNSPRKSAAQVLCNEDCPLMIISSRPRDCLFCEKLAWDFHIKKIHNCCVFPFACL